MTELVRLNVNPPTVHRGVTATEGLKVYMFGNDASDPGVTVVAKLPVAFVTVAELLGPPENGWKLMTCVAVAREFVLNVASPEKPMVPVIGTLLPSIGSA